MMATASGPPRGAGVLIIRQKSFPGGSSALRVLGDAPVSNRLRQSSRAWSSARTLQFSKSSGALDVCANPIVAAQSTIRSEVITFRLMWCGIVHINGGPRRCDGRSNLLEKIVILKERGLTYLL